MVVILDELSSPLSKIYLSGPIVLPTTTSNPIFSVLFLLVFVLVFLLHRLRFHLIDLFPLGLKIEGLFCLAGDGIINIVVTTLTKLVDSGVVGSIFVALIEVDEENPVQKLVRRSRHRLRFTSSGYLSEERRDYTMK